MVKSMKRERTEERNDIIVQQSDFPASQDLSIFRRLNSHSTRCKSKMEKGRRGK